MGGEAYNEEVVGGEGDHNEEVVDDQSTPPPHLQLKVGGWVRRCYENNTPADRNRNNWYQP